LDGASLQVTRTGGFLKKKRDAKEGSRVAYHWRSLAVDFLIGGGMH
jgi:hypothetical protein